jgi:hypothetical protein
MPNPIEARAAAVVALAGMAIRQLLDDAHSEDRDVVALRVECSHTADGAQVDFELIDKGGMAVGGGSL